MVVGLDVSSWLAGVEPVLVADKYSSDTMIVWGSYLHNTPMYVGEFRGRGYRTRERQRDRQGKRETDTDTARQRPGAAAKG